MSIFEILFYQPVFNVLVYFYHLFGDNLGWSIVMVAIISRIITIPLTNKQLKSAEQNKEFKVEYDKVKEKYKNNKEKQQEALAKLQMKFLPSQLGGCLPTILQFILLIQIRNAVVNLVVEGPEAFNKIAYPFVSKFTENQIINVNFLGVDLSKVATDFAWSDISVIWPYVLIAVLVGLSQFLASRLLMGMRPTDKKEDKKEVKKKKQGEPDIQEAMQNASKQMMYIFPFMTIFIALGYSGRTESGLAVFPSAIALFWMIQSFSLVAQEVIMNRVKSFKFITSKFNKNGNKTN